MCFHQRPASTGAAPDAVAMHSQQRVRVTDLGMGHPGGRQVCCRLTKLRGRRERNPWHAVTRVSGADLRSFSQDAGGAEAWLADLVRERGHHVGG